MRAEISKIQTDLGTTTLYVTHDQVEAMTMGDRVAVMRKGELQQVATPQTLYDHPVNLFVGGFIGSPAMNLVEADLVGENGRISAKLGDQTIALGDDTLSARPGLKQYAGRRVILGIRPEDLEDARLESDTPGDRRVKGKVELTEALGSEIMVHFTVNAKPALTEDVRELARDVGSDLAGAEQEAESGQTTLVGRFGARSAVKPGDTTEVAVDTRALHFFDLESGLGIYDGSEKEGS
jgi:multiple sugar transport system ATP-binding protein